MQRLWCGRACSLSEIVAVVLTLSACTDGSISDGDGGTDSAAAMDASAGDSDAGTSAEPPDTADGSGGSDTGDTAAPGEPSGQELYTVFCAACHGPEGEGSPLGYEIRHHTPEHFEWVVRHGRPGLEFVDSAMTAFNEQILPYENLAKIYDYLDAFPQPDTPEALYLDYCGNCHGPHGNDGFSENVYGKGSGDISEKVRQGEGGGDVGDRFGYMPRFDASRISDAELQLIVDFLGG